MKWQNTISENEKMRIAQAKACGYRKIHRRFVVQQNPEVFAPNLGQIGRDNDRFQESGGTGVSPVRNRLESLFHQ